MFDKNVFDSLFAQEELILKKLIQILKTSLSAYFPQYYELVQYREDQGGEYFYPTKIYQ
jgi:hypothetical protein